MVSRLKLAVPAIPPLPYCLETEFTGVDELDLSSFGGIVGGTLLSGVMSSPSGLRSLNLADNKMDHATICQELAAWPCPWVPSLSGLTYLSMARTDVHDWELAVLTPLLSSLTHLDLEGCADITLLLPNSYGRSPPLKAASLKGLTRLNLSSTKVGDEGMRTLASLTALTHLELDNTTVTARGVRSLAPLTTHLTHLALRSEECTDPELIAVCSLTALTRLEMLHEFRGGIFVGGCSGEGMSALSSLTGLVHLELHNDVSNDGALIAISSFTAIAHLRLRNSCYIDEEMRALACLTALTHLHMGAEVAFEMEYDGFAIWI
jgi:hypothetical protein